MKRWILIAIALAGCSPTLSPGSDGQTDGGSTDAIDNSDSGLADTDAPEGDTDTDADSDTDTDTDADADTDTDLDGDIDSDDSDVPHTGLDPFCDTVTPVINYISPDDSNSMASPAMARTLLTGSTLSDVPVRKYEFMNYYQFPYPPAPVGELDIDVQLVPSPDGTAGRYHLQIGVVSEARTAATRAPMNVVFALDTSCSMNGSPLDNLKSSMHAMSSQLRAGDVVSLTTWDSSQYNLIENHSVTGPNDPVITQLVDQIDPGGGTNLAAGLQNAYDLAYANQDPTRINRVVLISDGNANLGLTSSQLIGQYAGDVDEDGIYIVGIGTDTPDTYNDHLMDQVTDLGRGASVYINDADQAQAILAERFIEVMDVAARNVQVAMELPPGFEVVRFSGEAISSNPDDIDPQHLAPNDAMVFFQTVQTCAPDSVNDATAITVTVDFLHPTTFAPQSVTQTVTFGELTGQDPALLNKGAAVFHYAKALAAWKKSPGTALAEAARTEALAHVARAALSSPNDPEMVEIQAVLQSL